MSALVMGDTGVDSPQTPSAGYAAIFYTTGQLKAKLPDGSIVLLSGSSAFSFSSTGAGAQVHKAGTSAIFRTLSRTGLITITQNVDDITIGAADAPSDTKTYGRKDGAWAEVTGGGGGVWGTITGTLSNQLDLQAALNAKYSTTNPAGYISANQNITVSGDATGSGTTAIPLTLATVNSNVGTFNSVTVNAKGLVTAASSITYLTANENITISGEVTGSGTTAIPATLSNSAVIGKLLTGFTVGTNTAIVATDSIFEAFRKVQAQVNAFAGGTGFLKTDGSNAMTGNLNFSGSGLRISGDFSNGTHANRVMFQTNLVNGTTVVGLIPNGTGASSNFNAYGSSDPANSSVMQLICNQSGGTSSITSTGFGSGPVLPLGINIGASEKLRITTAGDVGIGTTTPNYQIASRALTLEGSTTATYEIASTRADADAVLLGTLEANFRTASAGHNRVAGVYFGLSGATAGQRGGFTAFYNKPNANATISEVARFTPAGGFLVGTTAPMVAEVAGKVQVMASNPQIIVRNSSSTAGKWWSTGADASNTYVVYNQAAVGVQVIDGATAWSATSDITLKTNLTEISGSNLWHWFKSIRTMNGRFLSDDESVNRSFLIAQDWTDRPDVTSTAPDGKLGMAHTNTLPYAYAILKEAMARIEQLEDRISALEKPLP